MQEATLIALFSIMGSWCLILTGLWWGTRGDVKKIRLAVELFISDMGKAAAIVMHSPDDHLGIDELLEKYVANHHDLSLADWLKLETVCLKLREDKTIPDAVRIAASTLMAAFLAQLAIHKISATNPEMKILINEALKSN